MKCPRCGNEWDASKSPCTRCGLVINMPGQPQSGARPNMSRFDTPQSEKASTSFQQTSGPLPGQAQRPTSANTRLTSGALDRTQPPPAKIANTPYPFNFTSVPVPNTPAVEQALPPAPSENRMLKKLQGTDAANMPSQTNSSVQNGQTFGGSGISARQQSSMQRSGNLEQEEMSTSLVDLRPLARGTLLRGGRYRLQELQGGQEWVSGVFEAIWLAQDAQRAGATVIICELLLPSSGTSTIQSILRTATMSLSSIGRHPRIPTLWDAFSDHKRHFFVYEPIEGDSLLYRMRRNGRALQESEVIECCLQMIEVLELLSQQSPPLVHGLIRPENIIISRKSSQYILTNFSVVLIGGATQYVVGMERARLSPYTSPDFVRGTIDIRSDLYSLLATAYHAVTGSIPSAINGNIPQAKRLNPNITPQFESILAKGLSSIASQRYQRPSELRQDLLSLRASSGSLISKAPESIRTRSQLLTEKPAQTQLRNEPSVLKPNVSQPVADAVALTFQSMVPIPEIEERKMLLPLPEELPPMRSGNDALYSFIWLAVIILGVTLTVFLSQRFM